MYTEKWKLTEAETAECMNCGIDIVHAQEGKKKAYIEAGGVILNPDALSDLYEACRETLHFIERFGSQRHLSGASDNCDHCRIKKLAVLALAKAEGGKLWNI